jgi:hypothetical protein
LLLICCCGQIACRAATLRSTTGQDGEHQILIHGPDVVVRRQSWQGLSGVMHRGCIDARQATYGMDIRQLPTTEVVIRNGQPVWRVCGAGLCIEDQSGIRAMAAFRALCISRGLSPSCDGPELPCRGPSESDEPGV